MPVTAPTALLVEDEPLLRDELRAALARLWPELRIAGEAADGPSALNALVALRPNVTFLDIELPELSGLDVARAASGRSHVVFVTAFDHYAVSAFERGALDFVLKPLQRDRLAMSVDRVRARLREAPPSLTALIDQMAKPTASREPLRWVSATQGSRIAFFAADDIHYLQAADKYTEVHMADGEALIRKSIRELKEELDPAQFWQIHRGTIVNSRMIAGLERDLRGHLKLCLKGRAERLPVSDAYAVRFRPV